MERAHLGLLYLFFGFGVLAEMNEGEVVEVLGAVIFVGNSLKISHSA